MTDMITITYFELVLVLFGVSTVVAIISYLVGVRNGAWEQHQSWTKWYRRQIQKSNQGHKQKTQPEIT